MSVRKRKWVTRKGEVKEAWVIDYVDQDGERHIETFEKRKDAVDRHSVVAVNVKRGLHVAPSKSVTLAEAAKSWLNRVEANGMRGRGPVERSTMRQYRQHVDLHIIPRIGRIKLANLTPPAVERFRDDLVANLSRPMARKVMVSFRSLLRAAKYSHVAADVSVGASKRTRRLEVGRDIPLPDEASRLIKVATDIQRRALLLTAAMTGLRASELRGLRWIDVDLTAGELHVRQRADRFCKIGPPKSEASVRTVPLPRHVGTILKEWKLACPKGGADLVFPTGKGEVVHHKNMLSSLAPVMVAAGLVKGRKPKYALHAFRHFFASWCINPKDRGGRGLPAKVVQHLLGHSSIQMTLDVYGHLFPDGSDRAELDAAASSLLG